MACRKGEIQVTHDMISDVVCVVGQRIRQQRATGRLSVYLQSGHLNGDAKMWLHLIMNNILPTSYKRLGTIKMALMIYFSIIVAVSTSLASSSASSERQPPLVGQIGTSSSPISSIHSVLASMSPHSLQTSGWTLTVTWPMRRLVMGTEAAIGYLSILLCTWDHLRTRRTPVMPMRRLSRCLSSLLPHRLMLLMMSCTRFCRLCRQSRPNKSIRLHACDS